MEKTEKNIAVYELAFLLPVGGSDEVLKTVLAKHGFVIEKEGGTKETKLAYKIEKQEVAQFGYYLVSLSKEEGASEGVIKNATNDLNLETDILRFLFIKHQEPKKRKVSSGEDKVKRTRKEDAIPTIDRIDHLSNEKLEETLEEILK